MTASPRDVRTGIAVAAIVAAVGLMRPARPWAGTAASPPQWPPAVHATALDGPAMSKSPADELRTFTLPPGYRAQLVASEPIVIDPVFMDWDPDGRLWVIEMGAYMPRINPTIEEDHAPLGRIVVLEDTNGDGIMDKRTVFADGLIAPRALKVLDHGVLVGEPRPGA